MTDRELWVQIAVAALHNWTKDTAFAIADEALTRAPKQDDPEVAWYCDCGASFMEAPTSRCEHPEQHMHLVRHS